MVIIGVPHTTAGKKVILCGSGELGKEVAIEFQRYGVEVIALDRYANAPAMQVANKSYVLSMLDGVKLREIIEKEKPDYIVPEVEAIATATLVELEKEGYNIVPTAKAAFLTMNREGIRRLAAEELGLKTSPYRFADTYETFEATIGQIGLPCVVKPIMSSSGHGQSVLRSMDQARAVWDYAQEGGRAGAGKVIVEGFVNFDYEITLLTVRHAGGTSFCEPIGHRQENGDYQESWQPQPMSLGAKEKACAMAKKITDALGGFGIFGVEMFVKGEEVIFSEVSPRPHDTGMVTMISQDLSEFALHVRAILGLPIPNIAFHGASASKAIVVHGESSDVRIGNLDQILSVPDTQIRLFGKPSISGHRRMGVILARGASVEEAKQKVFAAYDDLQIEVIPATLKSATN
jgi:phosphoribosylglycinamide formyltransferase 2